MVEKWLLQVGREATSTDITLSVRPPVHNNSYITGRLSLLGSHFLFLCLLMCSKYADMNISKHSLTAKSFFDTQICTCNSMISFYYPSFSTNQPINYLYPRPRERERVCVCLCVCVRERERFNLLYCCCCSIAFLSSRQDYVNALAIHGYINTLAAQQRDILCPTINRMKAEER